MKFGPTITPEELAKQRTERESKIDLTPYTDYLKGIAAGHAGTVYVEDDESKPVIKRRVTLAAGKLGKDVRYLRTDDSKITFVVESKAGSNGASAPQKAKDAKLEVSVT